MAYAFLFFMVVAGAFFNRARGSNFDMLIPSDTLTRLLAMSGFALLDVLRFMVQPRERMWELLIGATLLLWLWCCAGWDKYWSEAIGSTPGVGRATGVLHMTLRMALILPYYTYLVGMTGVPLWHLSFAASFLLMGLTYYISADVTPGKYTIRNAEWANGAIIAATSWLIGIE